MLKASLGNQDQPQTHFNGVIKDRNATAKKMPIGNKALKEIKSGNYNSRYSSIVHP